MKMSKVKRKLFDDKSGFSGAIKLAKLPNESKHPLRRFFNEFCDNSSLHALNQIAKPIYTTSEKFLWIVLFVLGVLGATYTCVATWERYTKSTTSTVIETTRYSYANVPFPSVTLCDKSRVDWARAEALNEEDLPEPFEVTKSKVLKILKRVAYSAFGDFDFFNQIRFENETFDDLNAINMTEILLKVMRPCEELFYEWCWFRDLEIDCCRIFELQRTEFGFCWSFNSDTSEPSRGRSKGWLSSGRDFWVDEYGVKRPRRTAQHGPWSGLKFKVIPMAENRLPPDGNHTTTGVVVTVADPKSELHNNYLFVPPGQEIRLPVWGENLIATKEVKGLKVKARNCLFPDEDPFGLPQGFYLAANCRAACYQNYTLKYCNCSPDFIFYNRDGWGNYYKPCDTSGLLCLSEYNDIFTYEQPPDNKDFFASNKPGIECSCPPDCTSQLYVTELTAPSISNISILTEIDVHFRLPECTQYRTEVVYQWLDMVVSFGGIAGLFLGASLLSAAEILFFCIVRSFCCLWTAKTHEVEKAPVYPFLH